MKIHTMTDSMQRLSEKKGFLTTYKMFWAESNPNDYLNKATAYLKKVIRSFRIDYILDESHWDPPKDE